MNSDEQTIKEISDVVIDMTPVQKELSPTIEEAFYHFRRIRPRTFACVMVHPEDGRIIVYDSGEADSTSEEAIELLEAGKEIIKKLIKK